MRNALVDVPELYQVRDINWSDDNIVRAGVIPIYTNGNRKWIGLGVSKFSSNINAIGGSHEDEDYDLLDTAVREYNEEVGNNLPHINVQSLIRCFAIKTNYTIQVLLPIKQRPSKFVETTELYNLIWVTPEQLQAMNNNQQFILPGKGKRSRAYAFSAGVRDIVEPLIKAVNSGIVFKLAYNGNTLSRSRKSKEVKEPKIITNIETFTEDAEIPSDFRGFIGIVVTNNIVAIIRKDRTVYYLPRDELNNVVTVLNQLGFRIIVSLNADRKILLNSGIRPNILSSIEHLFHQTKVKGIKGSEKIFEEFTEELGNVRAMGEYELIMNELNLLIEYEEISYKIIEREGVFFNEKRACFLDMLNRINIELNRKSVTFAYLHYLLGNQCGQISGSQIINVLIKTGVVVQNKTTTIISLP